MMQNYKRHLLIGAVCMIASGFIRTAYASQQFTDVPSTHWAAGYITAAANNNYVSGVGNNKFNPNAPVSHAEFHAMITKTFVPHQVEKFKDENQTWYMPFMKASEAMGYTDSTMMKDTSNWKTMASTPMTRYEMAMLVHNVFYYRGMTTNIDPTNAFIKLRDTDNVKDYYISSIADCYTLGILSGSSDGKFHGDDPVTRAEACAVLIRMDEKINNKQYNIGKPQTETQAKPQTKPDTTQTTPEPTKPSQKPNHNTMTEDQVIAKLKELEARFPDGTNWEKDIYNSDEYGGSYRSKVLGSGNDSNGSYAKDCAAWAMYASDYVFGANAPVIDKHHDWKKIKVGDVVAYSDGPNEKPYHWDIITDIGFDEKYDEFTFHTASSSDHHIVNWSKYYNNGMHQIELDPELGGSNVYYITVYSRY